MLVPLCAAIYMVRIALYNPHQPRLDLQERGDQRAVRRHRRGGSPWHRAASGLSRGCPGEAARQAPAAAVGAWQWTPSAQVCWHGNDDRPKAKESTAQGSFSELFIGYSNAFNVFSLVH